MKYIKIPSSFIITDLSPRNISILFHLSFLNFKFCGTGRKNTFFITDRDLAKELHCSTHSVYEAKKKLSSLGLIKYTIGEGNVTFYKL